MTLDIVSHSGTQTQRLGARLGELLLGGELILLEGQLGTGKTTFTQGLAQGMGITEMISSPTFTLLKEYRGQPRITSEASQDVEKRGAGATFMAPTSVQGPHLWRPSKGPALFHFDLYRLDDPEEIVALGFEEYFENIYHSGVSVVEWAEKAGDLWPPEHLLIRLKVVSETKRGLMFVATGARYCELVRQFQKNTYATVSS